MYNIRLYLRFNLVEAVLFLAASLVADFLLLSPKTLVGSNLPLLEAGYSSLPTVTDDSTRVQEKFLPGDPDAIPPDSIQSKKEEDQESLGRGATRDDSLGIGVDTTAVAAVSDTGYVVYLDSTARLAHFHYVRKDQPCVEPFPERMHPLFAIRRSASYRRHSAFDSTGTMMQFRETISDQDVKIEIRLPLRDYIKRRRAYELRNILAKEARKPSERVAKDDLGELLTEITQIQIPVPPNPIFSIFGKPQIQLNISGAVDIKAGFRNTKSDQIQVSALDQTRNEPDFSQEVQVNVNGTIGDKLNILADWNTQRTFEYENQLKIKYTGYEDEIVQSVEAGNVSLRTPSSFIGVERQHPQVAIPSQFILASFKPHKPCRFDSARNV